MHRNARLILTSVLITNVGNGAQTIAVAALLYQATKSGLALGAALTSEFVVAFLLQLFAGSVIDRGQPKLIMAVADLSRGLIVLAAALLYVLGGGLWPVMLSLVYLQITKPFYRAASFAFTPSAVSEQELPRVTALLGSFTQTGQLIGVGLAGPLIAYISPAGAFAVNGASFLLAGALILLVRGERVERKSSQGRPVSPLAIYDDWREMARVVRTNASLLPHVLLSSGDFLSVAFLNLLLVPMNAALHNNPIHLSLLDGSFAAGSILCTLFVTRLTDRIGPNRAVALGLAVQTTAFLALSRSFGLSWALAGMFVLGTFNTISVTTLMAQLQLRSRGPIKGRIGSLRHLTLSVFAMVLLPATSLVLDRYGVQAAVLTSGAVLALFLLGALVSSLRYGDTLLSAPVQVPPAAPTEGLAAGS